MTTLSSENKVELTFETTALNGLRGLLAVHMTIFHSLLHTEYEINTYAAVRFYFSTYIMPNNDQSPITGSLTLVFSPFRILSDIKLWKDKLRKSSFQS